MRPVFAIYCQLIFHLAVEFGTFIDIQISPTCKMILFTSLSFWFAIYSRVNLLPALATYRPFTTLPERSFWN